MKTALRFAGIGGVVLAAAYLAFVLLARSAGNREIERKIESRTAEKYKAVPASGGTDVKITQFYAESGQLSAGERTLVCYGVENARAVRLEPPAEPLDPTPNRCFWVAPKRTTTFKLVAQGTSGAEVSQSFTITVGAAAPRILFVQLSSERIRRGDKLTLCYGVEHAAALRLDPAGMKLAAGVRECVVLSPAATVHYALVASAPDGRSAREKFTVTVD
jgi:hypothetical protein